MKHLTDRQRKLLELLREDDRRSIRELQAAAGYHSTSSVTYALARLADAELITFERGVARSIRVVGQRDQRAARVVARARKWAAHDPALAEAIREYESQ